MIPVEILEAETVSESFWEIDEILHDALRSGPIENVLEVGSHAGDSLKRWRDAFFPSLLIGIEPEDSARTREGLDPLIAEGAKIIFGKSQDTETWMQVKNMLSGCICADPNRPIDFMYVDGDHIYESARRDFFLYAPLVRPGGLIVMDDAVLALNPEVEVFRLVPEISALYRTKLVSGKIVTINGQTITGGRLLVYAE